MKKDLFTGLVDTERDLLNAKGSLVNGEGGG